METMKLMLAFIASTAPKARRGIMTGAFQNTGRKTDEETVVQKGIETEALVETSILKSAERLVSQNIETEAQKDTSTGIETKFPKLAEKEAPEMNDTKTRQITKIEAQ